MVKEYKQGKVPIKAWLNDIEPGALEQAISLANLPFIHSHVALMPDCHQGFGMPIGGVVGLRDVVIPNAVGVDIGCGMCAVKTSVDTIETPALKSIIVQIKEAIPAGFKHHSAIQEKKLLPSHEVNPEMMPVVAREYEKARYQVGTLGGGNHFIEIQKGNDGFIWIMIHSGSRNIGKQVADHYNRLAIDINARRKSLVPAKAQLAWLPSDSTEGEMYWKEMEYCIDFAFSNRKLMMWRILHIFEGVFGSRFTVEPMINIAHNYASKEIHFGEQLVIHRKGATLADLGTIGIIPGSQGTKSYIVEGLGNPESFNSCSHGAGRLMGRKEAQRSLNLKEEIQKLNKHGIIHAIRNQNDLDEAAGAYKDIDLVMKNQKDLVKILVSLTPLAVIKG